MSLSVNDLHEILKAQSIIANQIKDAGYKCRIESDFDVVRNEIGEAGKDLTPFFWPQYNQFNEVDAFCAVLEKDGQGLAYICNQRFNLGTQTLADAYRQRLKAIYSHDENAKLDPNWVCAPLREVKGVVAYSGDAVAHSDLQKNGAFKSLNMLRLISMYALYFTFLVWKDVNWVFGTVREKDFQRGLAFVYGGSRCYSMAEKWTQLPENRQANYAVLLADQNDVLYEATCEVQRQETVTATHQLEEQER